MLTQTTPAVVSALRNVLPPAAIKQLTQALGNCGQPLTHRGPVALEPAMPRQAGGRGVYGGAAADGTPARTWNTQSFADLLPYNERAFYDMPRGGSSTNNYYGDNFTFPTTNVYNITNNTNITVGGGGTYIPGIITDRPPAIIPPAGADGRDGRDGIDGQDGAAGQEGAAGRDGVDGRDGKDGEAGRRGRAGRDGKDGADGADGADGISIQGPAGPQGPEGPASTVPGPQGPEGPVGPQGPAGDGCSSVRAITYLSGQPTLTKTTSSITYATEGLASVSLGTLQVDEDKTTITYVTNVTFDADTCTLTVTTATAELVTNAYLSGNLSTLPAATDTKTVVTNATLNDAQTSNATFCEP
jgi:hypothetical protein